VARYTQDSIERLREAVDMVALVSKRTDLRRVGTRWTGLCPFHEERTPSFSVNAEDKLYHCFGCQRGGDAIGFLMEAEGLDFVGAVDQLAEDYGVELKREHEDPQEEERRRRRERLLALLDRTAGFYAAFLRDAEEAAPAREYLAGRNLSPDLLAAFRVGYAPKAWERVLSAARRDGFTDDELLAAGVAQRAKTGKLYDRFRERITFPLADSRGRVLGFGARAMSADAGAKYINTSEGEIYHKGRQLFGIDRARAAIAREGRVIVAEGYTDVLALHGAGLEESVGIMGTALTQDQMAELARGVGDQGTVFMALDSDRSGQEAMLRAARLAEDRGVDLRVVRMPEGTDPADLIAQKGGEAITALLTRSLSVLEFEVGRVLEEGDLESPEGRERALVATRQLIARTPERSVRRDHLIGLVADRLDVPASYVAAAPERVQARPAAAAPQDPGREDAQAPAGPPGASAAVEAERLHLAAALGAGAAGREALAELTDEHLSSPVSRRARAYLLENFDDPLAGLSRDDAELAALVAGIALQAEEGGGTPDEVLRSGFLQLELRRIERQMRHARRDADFDLQGRLAAERQRVKDEMSAVMGRAQ
jgi:DNA primase